MFTTIIRTAVRSTLIQNGPQTCSEIVRGMGMDPRRHKGTIHAVMVDLEKEGILAATRADNGKRDLWFVMPSAIRKRDRIVAAMIG
jgi:predicted transcriptional regulator